MGKSGRSRFFSGALALVVAATFCCFANPRAAFAACSFGAYRAGDDSSHTNSTGVRGRLQIPSAAQVAGFGTTNGYQSVGDVFIYDHGASGFVQAGWYVGHADQLPYASKPTIFVGENHTGDLNNELLHVGFGSFNWSTNHYFKILKDSTPYGVYADIYVDGSYLTSTTYTHTYVDDAAFTGEVDYDGVQMYAVSAANSSPYATLQWENSAGTWSDFDDYRYTNDTHFNSIAYSGAATDVAYGGGNC